MWIRYLLWLQDVGRCLSPFGGPCTLGSDRNGGAVLPQLQTAIGSTLRLVVVATILALILGVVTGIVTALRQYSTFDYGVTFVAFLCFSLPVFWISTLLKQYVAIDLNTWLNNPTMTTAGLVILGVVVGALWALVIGGDRRRVLIVFATRRAGHHLGDVRAAGHRLLPASPYFGILGIAVFGVAAAVGWSALFAGLHRRGRPVLISAVTTAVAGAVIALAAADRDRRGRLVGHPAGDAGVDRARAAGRVSARQADPPARHAGERADRIHRRPAGGGRPAAAGLSGAVPGDRRPADQDHRFGDPEPGGGLLGHPAGLADVPDPADPGADAGLVRRCTPGTPGPACST